MRLWLVTARKSAGLSQKAVADAAGITQPSYYNIEHGERNPAVSTAKRIADVLGFDWTKFYSDEKDSEEEAS